MATSSSISFIRPRAAADDDDDDFSQPVGFRFHPTEEELVGHYLKMKLKGRDYLVSNIIPEIDVCKHEPWDLPAFSLISDDEEWFFFSRPKYKQKSRQRDRSTVEGYWKKTTSEKVIKTRDNRTVLGKKRILTFYRGRVRQAQKTNWVMHEYYITQTHPNASQKEFELIRLKKKPDENADVSTCDEGEPSTYNASDFGNQPQTAHNMDFQAEYTQPQEDGDYFETVRNLLLGNAQGYNDNNQLQSGFGANESDDSEGFLESLIVEPCPDSCEETAHITVSNDAILPKPLKRVYVEDGGSSSDTGTDRDITAVAQMMSLHRVSPIPIGLRQSASAVNVVPQPQPQPQPQQGSINVSILQGLEIVDLIPDAYYRNEQTRRRTYPPAPEKPKVPLKPQNVVQLAQNTSMPMPKPKPSISVNVARTNNAEEGTKQTQNITTARRCSFISWQTIPLTSPRSMYIFNMVLGVSLFLIFAREVVLYGQWC